MEIERIDPVQARAHMTTGNALLVCAYDSQEKFLHNQIAGALSLQELQAIENDIPRSREIIFYCA